MAIREKETREEGQSLVYWRCGSGTGKSDKRTIPKCVTEETEKGAHGEESPEIILVSSVPAQREMNMSLHITHSHS